ncbi:MAG TPA: SDR family oxidoreductase [Thermoplasmatales archaeon]|nr:SDR family oxidoreductase [Thermoplasmatales archaeon]
MKVAITGAAGYIGRKVVERLDENDACEKILGISRREFTHRFKKLDYHPMDVRSPRLKELFREYGIDAVIHLAFVVNPIHNEQEMHSIDIEGTKNVLDAAAYAGVKRIIVTSSTMVYGAWPDNPPLLTEESPRRGHRKYYYNRDKVSIEKMCEKFRDEHPDISLVILRPCLVLGPTVNHFYSHLLNWPVLPLVDGKNPPLQFVHEDDVAKAYELFLLNSAEGTYNIVGKETITWKEIIERAGKRAVRIPGFVLRPLLGMLWKLHLTEFPPEILDFITYPWVASGEKAEKEEGFSPQYSTEEVLEDVLKNMPARK